MPDLFTPYTLKGVTIRNRIAMSPMTMYRSEPDGKMNDFHLMLMGSRAAGGFGLVFPEQIAITPANKGLRWFKPDKSEISSLSKPSRANSKMTPNVANVVST